MLVSYFVSIHVNRSEHDYVSLILDGYVLATQVTVFTGMPKKPNEDFHRDKLDQGILEITTDGENFVQVARFIDGVADYLPQSPFMLKAVRIRATGKQGSWLAVREIKIFY